VKIVRITGLAAIAALALTAWLGAGSAVAAETTLCKSATNVPFCSVTDRYPASTTFQATASKVTINTSNVSFACASSIEGKTNTQSGKPLGINITSWSLSSCATLGGTKCSVEGNNANAPYAGSVTWTSGDDGDLTVKSGGSGAPSWLIECSIFMHCTLAFEPTLGMNGGNPGEIVAASEPMSTQGGFACPTKVEGFSGVYSVKSPTPAYVTQAVQEATHFRLCKNKPAGSSCPTNESYPAGTTITAVNSGNLTIETSSLNFACKEASISATTEALGAEPLPIKLNAYSLAGCTMGFSGGSNCTTETTLSSPSSIGLSGGVWFLQTGKIAFKFECGASFTCTFESTNLMHKLTGGNPATLNVEQLINPGSENCPGGTLKANFTVTAPKPLYPV
jgi:hypothetical protein